MMILREKLTEQEKEKLDEQLIDACDDQNLTLVRDLCLKGARLTFSESLSILSEERSIHLFNFFWQTKLIDASQEYILLKYAVSNCNLNLIQFLTENSIEFKETKERNVYLKNLMLTRAAEEGYLEIVDYLINNGADAIKADALNKAIDSYNLDLVKYLVEYLLEKNSLSKKTISTIVKEICQKGKMEVVNYFIEKFPYVLVEDELELLKSAANSENVEVIKLLIEKGLNVHIENDKPFEIAVKCKHSEIMGYLIIHHECDLNKLDIETKRHLKKGWFHFNDRYANSRNLRNKLNQELKEVNVEVKKTKTKI